MPLRRDTQALRLIACISLIQRREKCPSREEKVPSRSSFLLSMHVVLKTRHVNPKIHVRSPNFSTTRPQLFSLHAEQQPIRRGKATSTGQLMEQHWSESALRTDLYYKHLEREHFSRVRAMRAHDNYMRCARTTIIVVEQPAPHSRYPIGAHPL